MPTDKRITSTIVSFLSIAFLICNTSSAETFNFAKRYGGTNNEYAISSTTDSSGRIVILATLSGTTDLNGDGDSLDGVLETASGMGSQDAAIVVYNSSGNFVWGVRLGGANADAGYDIAVGPDDNIYAAISVNGAVDLNNDGDKLDGTAETGSGFGTVDAAFVQYDSSGNFVRSKRLGGTGADTPGGIDVTDLGSIYISGYVSAGAADLNNDGDKTDGTAETGAGILSVAAFFSIFDSSGNHSAAERFGNTTNSMATFYSTDIAVDSSGRAILICKGYEVDLNHDGDMTDGSEEVGLGSYDALISVYTSAGTFVWAKRVGGADYDYGYNIDVDSDDAIFAVGNITGAVDLNADGDTADSFESTTGFDNDDGFLVKYSPAGNFIWGKRIGGMSYDYPYKVTTDTAKNVYVTGVVEEDVDLNNDGDKTDTGEPTALGSGDGFVTSFDTSGNYLWSRRFGGAQYDEVYSVSANGSSSVLVAGLVLGNADLNGDGDNTDGGAESAGAMTGADIFFSSFLLDSTPPVISNITPSSGTTITAATTEITFSLDENGSCRLSLSDESFDNMSDNTDCTGDGTQSITCLLPSLGTDGTKSLYVACADGNGNEDTDATNEHISYTLDTTPPTLNITNLAEYLNDTTPSITGTATSSVSNVASVEYQADETTGSWTACSAADGSFNELSEEFLCAIGNALSEGNHTIYFRATDSVGNVTSASYVSTNTTIDTSSPHNIVVWVNKDNKRNIGEKVFKVTTQKPTLYFSLPDELSDVHYIRYSDKKEKLGRAEWKGYHGTLKLKFTKDGDKNVYIQLKDAAGNVSDIYLQKFKVVTGSPEIKSVFIDGNAVLLNNAYFETNIDTPIINGIANEDVSSVTLRENGKDIGIDLHLDTNRKWEIHFPNQGIKIQQGQTHGLELVAKTSNGTSKNYRLTIKVF